MAAAIDDRIPREHRDILAGLVRQLREEAGLRQQDLAERLGVPDNLISNVEIGQRRLDVLEFRLLSQALGLSPIDVMERLESLISQGE